MMRRLSLSFALLGFALAPAAHAQAPLVDVYLGGYSWDAGLSGDLASGGNDADVENDLGFDSARQNVIYLGVEHPVPLLPNARLRFANLSDSANGTLEGELTYGPITFTDQTRVATDFQFDYQDLTLYYTPFDLVFKLDLGLNIRRVDAEIEIEDRDNSSNRHRADASATLPMLHVAASGDLPLTGFYATGELSAISYDGNRISDARAGLGWRSDFLLGVELGYSQMNIKLDDVDDLDADLAIGGPYLALSLSF